LGFNDKVPPGGYAWWYLDALSDDGQNGITIIGFIGSVFSPYYRRAIKAGRGKPENHVAENHVAMNVALYGKSAKRWAMTERGQGALSTSETNLTIGPSRMTWDGASLLVEIDEIAAPLPRRMRGTIRLTPSAVTQTRFTLNPEGGHGWWPIAPIARVEVALDHPKLAWRGNGYFDHNRGSAPIASGFQAWNWARARVPDGALVLYDGTRRDGSPFLLGLHYDETGRMTPFTPPPRVMLPASFWRIARETRSETGHQAKLVETLEDTPFYARSVISSRLAGRDVIAMHESLSLARFENPVVQLMLPFRMPRRTW